MEEMIGWLVNVEERASHLYEKAAQSFPDDLDLFGFLTRMSDDERGHADALRKAYEIALGKKEMDGVITLDKETREGIEGVFKSFEEELERGPLALKRVMEFMIEAEFSEQNTLFACIMSALRRDTPGFARLAAEVQHHKKEIIRFIESRREFRGLLDEVRSLPDMWDENILIVDNEPVITDVLKTLLEDEGAVETASNGEEGLGKLKERRYSAIISDIKMKTMDGMEFYRKAVQAHPEVKGRFIFFAGSYSPEDIAFMRDEGVRYIQKPSSIRAIKEAVNSVIRGI